MPSRPHRSGKNQAMRRVAAPPYFWLAPSPFFLKPESNWNSPSKSSIILEMSSMIDSPEIRSALIPMSVDFYHAAAEMGWIDEDVELLEGFPVKKMSKSPEHEYFVRLMLRMLEKVLGNDRFVAKESPLTCSESEPEPDLMVVSGDEFSFRKSHPTTADLVIEVAIYSLDRDRRKTAIYANAGVNEYWLVDPRSRSIEVFRAPSETGYSQEACFSGDGIATSQVIPGFEVKVAEFFA